MEIEIYRSHINLMPTVLVRNVISVPSLQSAVNSESQVCSFDQSYATNHAKLCGIYENHIVSKDKGRLVENKIRISMWEQ